MAKKISIDEIKKLKSEGINVIDATTGEPLDLSDIEKRKDNEASRRLMESQRDIITTFSDTMKEFTKAFKTLNESILKIKPPEISVAPAEPQITVEPKVDVQVIEQTIAGWKHRGVKTSSGWDITSIPTDDLSTFEDSGLRYK